jgi:hypothetical protein
MKNLTVRILSTFFVLAFTVSAAAVAAKANPCPRALLLDDGYDYYYCTNNGYNCAMDMSDCYCYYTCSAL